MAARILRMSSLFVRTLRDDPNDAEVPSHRLLVRAGYIRRNAPGIYTWLPLGLRVLRKIEAIIREEMDDMGAQELSFPALLPKEPYEATNRWTEYGPNIFRLQDRKGADVVHLLADDVLDLAQHAQAERQPGVDARGVAADVAGADEQPVARHLGVVGVVAQGAHEQGRHAEDAGCHARKDRCGPPGTANQIGHGPRATSARARASPHMTPHDTALEGDPPCVAR